MRIYTPDWQLFPDLIKEWQQHGSRASSQNHYIRLQQVDDISQPNGQEQRGLF
jgi:hypothetical protein